MLFLYICLLDFVDQAGNGLAGYFLNVFTNDSQHGETIVDETGIAVADHADIGRYAAAEPLKNTDALHGKPLRFGKEAVCIGMLQCNFGQGLFGIIPCGPV